MVALNLRISGISKLVSNLNKIRDKQLYDDTVKEVAELTAIYAKERAAVDTGELVDSIDAEPDGDCYVVKATAEHAWFNEFGCYNIPQGGRVSRSGKIGYTPFMRPAAIRAKAEAGGIFAKGLRARWI